MLTETFFSFSLTSMHGGRLVALSFGPWGTSMKKTYEKPTLVKREKLSSIIAIVGSGPF